MSAVKKCPFYPGLTLVQFRWSRDRSFCKTLVLHQRLRNLFPKANQEKSLWWGWGIFNNVIRLCDIMWNVSSVLLAVCCCLSSSLNAIDINDRFPLALNLCLNTAETQTVFLCGWYTLIANSQQVKVLIHRVCVLWCATALPEMCARKNGILFSQPIKSWRTPL